jgi:hypothetical protein
MFHGGVFAENAVFDAIWRQVCDGFIGQQRFQRLIWSIAPDLRWLELIWKSTWPPSGNPNQSAGAQGIL